MKYVPYIIAVCALGFATALADLLIYNPTVTNNWFNVLHWWGKAGTILAGLCIPAIIGLIIYKKTR